MITIYLLWLLPLALQLVLYNAFYLNNAVAYSDYQRTIFERRSETLF